MERLTYKDSTLLRATEHGELIRAYSDYNPRTIINKLSEYEDLSREDAEKALEGVSDDAETRKYYSSKRKRKGLVRMRVDR